MPQKPKYKLPDVSKNFHNVGRNIGSMRKAQGLSQKELAQRVGISQALLSHYEIGRVSIPVEVLIQIAISLKVPTDSLLGLDKAALSNVSPPNRRVLQRLKLISQLPPFEQKALLKTIDTYLKGAEKTEKAVS